MPFLSIFLLNGRFSENSVFLAKRAKTYDEEKNVADKAPVEGISINNLNPVSTKKIKIICSC